mmetsp:Transcript_65109/g.174540  ORF Transcript_65109/g.174540 Transcript_65109/m.174540 type:complete len:263 (-) Transcript_65109:3351-4139(-)
MTTEEPKDGVAVSKNSMVVSFHWLATADAPVSTFCRSTVSPDCLSQAQGRRTTVLCRVALSPVTKTSKPSTAPWSTIGLIDTARTPAGSATVRETRCSTSIWVSCLRPGETRHTQFSGRNTGKPPSNPLACDLGSDGTRTKRSAGVACWLFQGQLPPWEGSSIRITSASGPSPRGTANGSRINTRALSTGITTTRYPAAKLIVGLVKDNGWPWCITAGSSSRPNPPKKGSPECGISFTSPASRLGDSGSRTARIAADRSSKK